MHFGYFCVASCLCWGSYLLFVLVGRKRFGSELATDTLGQTAFNHHHQINTCHAYWKWFLIISDLLQDCAVFESAKPSQTWLNESHTLLSVYVRPKGVRTDMAHASGAFISSISFIIINVSVIHSYSPFAHTQNTMLFFHVFILSFFMHTMQAQCSSSNYMVVFMYVSYGNAIGCIYASWYAIDSARSDTLRQD